MRMTRLFSLLLALIFPLLLVAQNFKDTTMSLHMVAFHVSGHMPGGDLGKRYGSFTGVGASHFYKSASNWIIQPEFSYFSGSTLKDTTLFDNIKDENGQFISMYGEFADVSVYMRGFYAGIKGGKLFPVFGPNPNSGLMILGSVGFLQHKTFIYQETKDVPLLNGDYQKGWDHLSNGLATSQFIGYLHLDNNRPVNFYAGFEFHQAWTKNRRDWNFDLMGPDDRQYRDLSFGIKIGWIFPINKKSTSTYYYF